MESSRFGFGSPCPAISKKDDYTLHPPKKEGEEKMNNDEKSYATILIIVFLIASLVGAYISWYELTVIENTYKFCEIVGNGTHVFDGVEINCTAWNTGDVDLALQRVVERTC